MKKSIPRSQVARTIDGDDEFKEHSRTSPEVQFKEFRSTKKTKHGTDYVLIEKNQIQKLKYVKMTHTNNKPLARNENLVQTKTRPRMNYECMGKTVKKQNRSQKSMKKTVKTKKKLPHVNKKH